MSSNFPHKIWITIYALHHHHWSRAIGGKNVWSAVKSCLKIFPPNYSHARNFFPSISNMAAAADERNRSLKQALIESLTAILSPDQQARQLAEEQLKVLEVTEGKIIPLFWIIDRSCAKFLDWKRDMLKHRKCTFHEVDTFNFMKAVSLSIIF